MNFLKSFSDPSVRDVSVGGGKGANLAALTQAGFPVPHGVVVVPDAYRAFIAPLAARIADLTRDLDPVDHARIDDVHRAIELEANTLRLSTELADEVREFISRAGASSRWAVRSSGTAEDTANAAFAGQHDTYLNRTTPDDVIEHVRRCWLSLWSPRAIAYRARVGVSHTDIAMAVVIQEMVFSEVSGVAFSIDPVDGALDRVVINANFGLGESVVSGEGDVDHIIVDKATGRVVEARVAKKTQRVIATEQGTAEIHMGGDDVERAALTNTHIATLTTLIGCIERHYGWPQDIEWGLADGQLWLLQSRPVTTVPARWTRDESAERFPNPVTPFTWDFVEEGFHRSLNHSFELMGLPAYSGKWFALFGGYVYGNQNAVELYARRSPAPDVKSFADLQRHLPALLERFAWLRDLPATWHAALPAYLDAMDAFAREPVETYTLTALWDFVERLNAVGTEYFLPNIAISIGHGVLHRALHGLLALAVDPAQVDVLAHALIECETMTTRVNARLHALAATALGDAELAAALRSTPSRELWSRGMWATTPFWIAFRAFLDDHGHRETDFDALHPTWADAPWVVLDQIRALLDAPAPASGASAASAAQTEAAVLAHVPSSLEGIARGIITLAREYTMLDDLEHYHTTRLSRPMRRAVLEIGSRLVHLGLLTRAEDAFYASKASLRQMCASGVRSADERARFVREVRENLEAYRVARAQAPAWELDARERGVSDDPNALDGIPGSPGVAEGVVHIVRGVEDFASFPVGAVLVARTTNPAWTSLFYSASAVVTEAGGPLSHGAVTAREMGIPAVMAVRNVLGTLSNGDRVRVDGTSGRVMLASPLPL